MLSITNPTAPPFQKVCENCHVIDVTISPIGGVYCIDCHSKSTIQKLSFLCGSIATNDELVLLTIEGKWLETIMHMKKLEFLDFPCLKQVQLLISIRIHIKFCLSTTSTLAGFQENIQQFIPQVETSLKGKALFTPSIIIPNDNVQQSVKRKLDFT